MAAFCTCCGEVITAKSVTCMACGAPAHGMNMKVAKLSGKTLQAKLATVEALPVAVTEGDLSANRMIAGCCAA